MCSPTGSSFATDISSPPPGVTAGIDLCLSLVAEDWGHELAVHIAKRLVVYIQREGGQSQYSPYIGAGKDEDPIISKVHRYVTEHIADAFPSNNSQAPFQ